MDRVSQISAAAMCMSDDFRAIFSLLWTYRIEKNIKERKKIMLCKNFVVFHCANFHRLTRWKFLSPVPGLKGPKIARKSSGCVHMCVAWSRWSDAMHVCTTIVHTCCMCVHMHTCAHVHTCACTHMCVYMYQLDVFLRYSTWCMGCVLRAKMHT